MNSTAELLNLAKVFLFIYYKKKELLLLRIKCIVLQYIALLIVTVFLYDFIFRYTPRYSRG